MSDSEIQAVLWNDKLPKNGELGESTTIIFEQYKLYVEMADRISSRRDTANNFFLAINSALIASGAPLLEKYVLSFDKWFLVFPLLIVSTQLFFWWRLINSYKQLNGAKFRIIGELEEKLPARIYGKTEWQLLLKSGKDNKAYWPLTHLESKIPWVFFFGYLALFLAYILPCRV